DHISLDSPINGITLVDTSALGENHNLCSSAASQMPWRGFASLALYREMQSRNNYSLSYATPPGYYPPNGYTPGYGGNLSGITDLIPASSRVRVFLPSALGILW